jgi:hypothetical protein
MAADDRDVASGDGCSRPMEKVGRFWCQRNIERHCTGTRAGRGCRRGNGDQIVREKLDLVGDITGNSGNCAIGERTRCSKPSERKIRLQEDATLTRELAQLLEGVITA